MLALASGRAGNTYFFDDISLERVSARCGDGTLQVGEQCDTGAANGTGTCSFECTLVGP